MTAFTIRSLYKSDKNIVSIELEISGVLFLRRGHYTGIARKMYTYTLNSLNVESSSSERDRDIF